MKRKKKTTRKQTEKVTSIRFLGLISKMKSFSRKKLIKGLKKYTDINEAEEYVRSYPIALSDKIQILNENEKLNELRESKTNYSPFQIKKVN